MMDDFTKNLKPCPFCGSLDVELFLDSHPLYKGKQAYINYVICNSCGGRGGSAMGIAEEHYTKNYVRRTACSLWNQRPELLKRNPSCEWEETISGDQSQISS